MNGFLELSNGGNALLADLPRLCGSEFRSGLLSALAEGCRLSSFFALPEKEGTNLLIGVLLNPRRNKLELAACEIGTSYPALTPENPVFHWFEREIFEQYAIRPEKHPWLKPIRFQDTPGAVRPAPGCTEYFTMRGSAAHEVAVGPVHAGVIEPGHFRFQCMGEDVYSLEIELGYQHRNIEKLLEGGPDVRTLSFLETASGDTSAAAGLCSCSLLESLGGLHPSPRAAALRTLALELERVANHIGDLGALAGDVAFLPTASYCGRIRGDFLNRTALLCGNRFGRGFILPGGVRYDLSPESAADLLAGLPRSIAELENALTLMFEEPSVLDRFENTGAVSTELAREIGLVGVAGRASGLDADARRDLSGLSFADPEFVPEIRTGGDVFARADVRRGELKTSLRMIEKILSALPEGACEGSFAIPRLKADSIACAVAEAWRGELCSTLVTDGNGKIRRMKIVDPSFHNWFGLAMALRGQQISDFPICNKSFNLSYCGHDL